MGCELKRSDPGPRGLTPVPKENQEAAGLARLRQGRVLQVGLQDLIFFFLNPCGSQQQLLSQEVTHAKGQMSQTAESRAP